MTSTITARWNERVLPINDGLYFSDGRSLSVNLTSFPPPSIEIGAPCDPEAFHRGDRDEVTPIDCLTTLRMADSAGPDRRRPARIGRVRCSPGPRKRVDPGAIFANLEPVHPLVRPG
ncbi:hypothetical protein ACVBGC_17815 [Burkholderia stagnalis]